MKHVWGVFLGQKGDGIHHLAFFLISLGAILLIFSTVLLLIGLVDWAWHRAHQHLLQR